MTNPSYENYPTYESGQSDAVADDFAKFEVNSAADLAGADAQRFHGTQFVDRFFGDGTTPHPIHDPAANGYSHTKGTGKLNVGAAIAWALSVYKTNLNMWLVIGLLIALLGVLSQVPFLAFMGLAFSIARLLLDPVFNSAALQQTLAVNVSRPQSPAYGKALGVLVVNRIIIGAIAAVLAAIAFVVALMVTGFDPSVYGDPTSLQTDPAAIRRMVMDTVPGVVAAGLCVLLLLPFTVYPVLYAADNAGSFGFSLGQGMKAGQRTYGSTLLLVIFTLFVGFIGSLPIALIGLVGMNTWAAIGLSFLLTAVLAPLGFLASAHAYRQISGGPVPHATSVTNEAVR